MTKLANLRRALDRLAKSTTWRKRGNAIIAFKRVMRELSRDTLETYRPIRPDGTEVPSRKKKGGKCPYCKAIFRDRMLLIEHMQRFHDFPSYGCECGWRTPQQVNSDAARVSLCRHLVGVGDLALHLAKAELLAVAKERRAEA